MICNIPLNEAGSPASLKRQFKAITHVNCSSLLHTLHNSLLTGLATTVSFHVTVMSLDTIDEGSMVRSFVPPFPKAPSASKRMLIEAKGGSFLQFYSFSLSFSDVPTSVLSLMVLPMNEGMKLKEVYNTLQMYWRRLCQCHHSCE